MLIKKIYEMSLSRSLGVLKVLGYVHDGTCKVEKYSPSSSYLKVLPVWIFIHITSKLKMGLHLCPTQFQGSTVLNYLISWLFLFLHSWTLISQAPFPLLHDPHPPLFHINFWKIIYIYILKVIVKHIWS